MRGEGRGGERRDERGEGRGERGEGRGERGQEEGKVGGQHTFQKKYLPKLSMQGLHVCEGEGHVVIILPMRGGAGCAGKKA